MKKKKIGISEVRSLWKGSKERGGGGIGQPDVSFKGSGLYRRGSPCFGSSSLSSLLRQKKHAVRLMRTQPRPPSPKPKRNETLDESQGSIFLPRCSDFHINHRQAFVSSPNRAPVFCGYIWQTLRAEFVWMMKNILRRRRRRGRGDVARRRRAQVRNDKWK